MKFELNEYHRNITDEELLSDVRFVAEKLGKDTLFSNEYTENGRFHSTTLYNRFGSWEQVLLLAGLETKGHNFAKRTPNIPTIEEVNKLFKEGNRIDLYTSRFGIEDDVEVTKQWLKENGVNYTTLTFGKPHYDFILDDKALRVKNPKI